MCYLSPIKYEKTKIGLDTIPILWGISSYTPILWTRQKRELTKLILVDFNPSTMSPSSLSFSLSIFSASDNGYSGRFW